MKQATAVRRALITGSALALLAGAGVSAASAHRLAIADPTGDVWQYNSLDPSTSPTPAPDQTNGDITATKIRYAKPLTLRIKMEELKRTGQNGLVVMGSDIRTSAKKGFSVALFGTYGHWRGHSELDHASTGRRVKCHVTGSFDYIDNLAVVKIPGSCLGNPRWVRLRPGVETSTDAFSTTGSGTFYFDDALDSGHMSSRWSNRIHRF